MNGRTTSTKTAATLQEKSMKQTFDLNEPSSGHRHLFQFWVWNEDSDEVLDQGSIIVSGDTDVDATRNLRNALKARLADRGNSQRVRFHFQPIHHFDRNSNQEQVSVDTVIDRLREIMTGGIAS